MEDQQLVRQALSGQSRAFDQLFQRYRSWVTAKITASVSEPDEVEDLVQEIFCSAFEQLPRLREPALFGPWLHRLAANATASWGRHRQCWRRIVDAGQAHDDRRVEQPDEIYERDEEIRRVGIALEAVSPVCSRALRLFYYEGRSYKDIAAESNVKVASVRFRLIKGRRELRRRLGQGRPF